MHELPQRVRDHARRAIAMFAERFGRSPTVVTFAPGRVNLIGEHTDYNEGFVLPIAIERETIIALDRADDGSSTIVATDLDHESRIDLAREILPQRDSPANYLLGVADQFRRRGMAIGNLDVLITSSVPMGAGLSSSAAVETAFAMALVRLLGVSMSPLEMARLCQAAEHAFPGTPCGIMDMYIAAAARANHALLIDCRSEHARQVSANFAALDASLVVIDTGIKHALAGSAYADRRTTCRDAAQLMGVPSLRDATIESLNVVGLSDDHRRCALHVIAENTRTVLAAEALALGDLTRFGELMFQSHASLRDLYQVSCAELDGLVGAAKSMNERSEGVFGARMTGGGFGGCAIVLCQREATQRIIDTLTEAFVDRFDREPAGVFETAAAGGAQSVAFTSFAGDAKPT